MFAFVFDDALFELNVATPSDEPLFQLPPTIRARKHRDRADNPEADYSPNRGASCSECKKITECVIFKFYKTGGFAPCTPINPALR